MSVSFHVQAVVSLFGVLQEMFIDSVSFGDSYPSLHLYSTVLFRATTTRTEFSMVAGSTTHHGTGTLDTQVSKQILIDLFHRYDFW